MVWVGAFKVCFVQKMCGNRKKSKKQKEEDMSSKENLSEADLIEQIQLDESMENDQLDCLELERSKMNPDVLISINTSTTHSIGGSQVQFAKHKIIKRIPMDQERAVEKAPEHGERNPHRRYKPLEYIYKNGGYILDRKKRKYLHVPPNSHLPPLEELTKTTASSEETNSSRPQ